MKIETTITSTCVVLITETNSRGHKSYLEVSMSFDYLKLTKKPETVNYRILTSPTDQLARWTGRPLSIVTQEALDAGLKAIDESLVLAEEARAVGRTHPAYKAMQSIVEDTVQAYHADFYYHDTQVLSTMFPDEQFVWSAGRHGTHFFNDVCMEGLLRRCSLNAELAFYFWDGETLRLIASQIELMDTFRSAKLRGK